MWGCESKKRKECTSTVKKSPFFGSFDLRIIYLVAEFVPHCRVSGIQSEKCDVVERIELRNQYTEILLVFICSLSLLVLFWKDMVLICIVVTWDIYFGNIKYYIELDTTNKMFYFSLILSNLLYQTMVCGKSQIIAKVLST